jgi:UDP-N-acetylglucosamine--N-acetylmuramyl-(pentapeptide) pyrophosphoryl-undecaprenol N-acetylglucosamine transferase
MPKIVFTGGGTAGHVIPNLALIEKFQTEGWDITYIGSEKGLEKDLIARRNIPYYSIASGKLRRYFDWQNFIDPFKTMLGIIQAWRYLGKIKPKVIFSKGGFVAFPVVFAAWLRKIPVVAHESDHTPGLANKLSFPFAKKICISFPETEKYLLPYDNVIYTGTPIRPQFFTADAKQGLAFCDFDTNKKVILIMGGGTGSEIINKTIINCLPKLLDKYQVIHLCGKGKKTAMLEEPKGYQQYEYLDQELFDVMACADIVISRSGANALLELVVLKKLHLLIPLSRGASRGDQIVNAEIFAEKGISKVLLQENLTEQNLLTAIDDLIENAEQYRQAREKYNYKNGTEGIYQLLNGYV